MFLEFNYLWIHGQQAMSSRAFKEVLTSHLSYMTTKPHLHIFYLILHMACYYKSIENLILGRLMMDSKFYGTIICTTLLKCYSAQLPYLIVGPSCDHISESPHGFRKNCGIFRIFKTKSRAN